MEVRRCKKCGETRRLIDRPFSLRHRIRCQGEIEEVNVETLEEFLLRLCAELAAANAEIARLRGLVESAFDEGTRFGGHGVTGAMTPVLFRESKSFAALGGGKEGA